MVCQSDCLLVCLNFGPLTGEIGSGVWGPSIFQRVMRLGGVTARHSSTGRKPNFAALNRGCHLYSAGQPSRWALAHISSFAKIVELSLNVKIVVVD